MQIKCNNFLKMSIIGIILLSVLNGLYAKNLGVMGVVYPIAEPDLLQILQKRAIGSKNSFQTQWNQMVFKALDQPKPVSELSPALQTKTWFFNPSFKLSDTENQKMINPLNQYSLKKTLIFYDGNDSTQVRLVQRLDKKLKGNDTLILVCGSVLRQIQLFHKPIYYDQAGLLTSRFQFNHVPAMIVQENKRLKITEIKSFNEEK